MLKSTDISGLASFIFLVFYVQWNLAFSEFYMMAVG